MRNTFVSLRLCCAVTLLCTSGRFMKGPSCLRFGLLIVKPHGDGVGLGFWSFPIALQDGVGV